MLIAIPLMLCAQLRLAGMQRDEVRALLTTTQSLACDGRQSDTVARLGGDEFVLTVESIEEPQEMRHTGDKLFDMLTDPMTMKPGVIEKLGASMGLALCAAEGAGLNELLHVSDQAACECKSTGFMSLE